MSCHFSQIDPGLLGEHSSALQSRTVTSQAACEWVRKKEKDRKGVTVREKGRDRQSQQERGSGRTNQKAEEKKEGESDGTRQR